MLSFMELEAGTRVGGRGGGSESGQEEEKEDGGSVYEKEEKLEVSEGRTTVFSFQFVFFLLISSLAIWC